MKLLRLSELSCLEGFWLDGGAVELLGAEPGLAFAEAFVACEVDVDCPLDLSADDRELLTLMSCSAFCGDDCGVSMRVCVSDAVVIVFVLVGDRDDFTKDAHLKEGARFTGLSASFFHLIMSLMG